MSVALRPVFYQRDFSGPRAAAGVTWVVNRYSHAAVGGPVRASLTAYGDVHALWELVELLRCPVELAGETGQAVWWGYVADVTVRVNALEIGVSVQEMANRVAVAYSRVAPGTATVGERATTSWAQDGESVTAYGTKERLFGLAGATDAAAEAARDTWLSVRRWPVVLVSGSGARESLSATVICHGWWDTLDWTYYAQAAGKEGYEDIGAGTQAVGDDNARLALAQSFVLGSSTPWSAYSARLRLRRQGVPSDNVVVELCADSAGAPGTVLASASLSGGPATLAPTVDWREFVLSPQAALALGTTYWLKVRRDGAVSGADHYVLDVNEALGYAGGVLRIWDGSTWSARDPDADLVFAVTGQQETTEQIANAVAAEGQFITGVVVTDPSGVYSSQYRDGDATALTVVAELLGSGLAGGGRLLARVLPNRKLELYAEPAAASARHYLGTDLRLFERGREVPRWTCPVAVWAKLRDVVPATADLTKTANPSVVFVEESEYDPQTDEWRPTARSVPSGLEAVGGLVRA